MDKSIYVTCFWENQSIIPTEQMFYDKKLAGEFYVALDFTKVVPQVTQMGTAMANQNTSLSQRVDIALEQFENLPDNAMIVDRVKLARVRDAGYRGVAPIGATSEPINSIYPCPSVPKQATIIASDGSQIYPDQHSAAFYFLTNIGIFTYFHGENRLPQQFSEPHLYYGLEDTHDRSGNPIKNAVVNAHRTIREMELLAEHAWLQRSSSYPILALYDGPLLFWLGQDVLDADRLERDYNRALTQLFDTHTTLLNTHNQHASLVGYIDRPSSRFAIAMLHLLGLDEADVRRRSLESLGQYEGLTDIWLFREILGYGERSALMIQQSPQNKHNRNEVGEDYEIVFFYVNVAKHGVPYLARIEMPMWVAKSIEAVNFVHALIVSQCEIMGYYPYALTRADEIAVVRSSEKQALEDIIRTEMIRNEQPFEESSKLTGKHQTRSNRKQFGNQIKS